MIVGQPTPLAKAGGFGWTAAAIGVGTSSGASAIMTWVEFRDA